MNQHSEIHAASQLIRTGRFLEAVTTLQHVPTEARRLNGLADALLADVLQRVGQNVPAEEIALQQLRRLPQLKPSLRALSLRPWKRATRTREDCPALSAICNWQLGSPPTLS